MSSPSTTVFPLFPFPSWTTAESFSLFIFTVASHFEPEIRESRIQESVQAAMQRGVHNNVRTIATLFLEGTGIGFLKAFFMHMFHLVFLADVHLCDVGSMPRRPSNTSDLNLAYPLIRRSGLEDDSEGTSAGTSTGRDSSSTWSSPVSRPQSVGMERVSSTNRSRPLSVPTSTSSVEKTPKAARTDPPPLVASPQIKPEPGGHFRHSSLFGASTVTSNGRTVISDSDSVDVARLEDGWFIAACAFFNFAIRLVLI